MQANARVTWIGARQFVGVDSSKHSVIISSQDEENGTGMNPLELMLVALGSCTAMGVVDILQRKRAHVQDFEVRVSGELEQGPPRGIHSINLEYVIKGTDISEKAVADAIRLSLEKYCSVSGTMKSMPEVIPTFQIIDG